MRITESIIDVAVRKATEAGLFSRHCTSSEMQANREIVRSILDAVAAADTTDAAMPEQRPAEPRRDAAHSAHGRTAHERRAGQPNR